MSKPDWFAASLERGAIVHGSPYGLVAFRTVPRVNDEELRLIAAAPDLLEALQGMSSVWRSVCNSKGWDADHISQHVKARAAIAKATGEQQ